MKPNEHLKSMMRGRRKALTMYSDCFFVNLSSPLMTGSMNEMDSDVQIFLNELARVYERDRTTAVMFMVSAKRELQRKQLPDIRA